MLQIPAPVADVLIWQACWKSPPTGYARYVLTASALRHCPLAPAKALAVLMLPMSL